MPFAVQATAELTVDPRRDELLTALLKGALANEACPSCFAKTLNYGWKTYAKMSGYFRVRPAQVPKPNHLGAVCLSFLRRRTRSDWRWFRHDTQRTSTGCGHSSQLWSFFI